MYNLKFENYGYLPEYAEKLNRLTQMIMENDYVFLDFPEHEITASCQYILDFFETDYSSVKAIEERIENSNIMDQQRQKAKDDLIILGKAAFRAFNIRSTHSSRKLITSVFNQENIEEFLPGNWSGLGAYIKQADIEATEKEKNYLHEIALKYRNKDIEWEKGLSSDEVIRKVFQKIIKHFNATQIPLHDPLYVNGSKEAHIEYSELYTFENEKEHRLAICFGRNSGIAYPELKATISIFMLKANITYKEMIEKIEDSEPMKSSLLTTYIKGELTQNLRIIMDSLDNNGFNIFSFLTQREKTKGTFPYDFIVERERRYKASIIMGLAEVIIKDIQDF